LEGIPRLVGYLKFRMKCPDRERLHIANILAELIMLLAVAVF
jgi:hypothetical protein